MPAQSFQRNPNKSHCNPEVQQETTLDLSARKWKKIDHVSGNFLKDVLAAIEESYEQEQ